MRDNGKAQNYEQLKQIVTAFCEIIFTSKDSLDTSIIDAKKWMDNLTSDDIEILNSDENEMEFHVRTFIQDSVGIYIKNFYQNISISQPYIPQPFEFTSGGAYLSFCDKCEKYYKENHSNNNLPRVLKIVLVYIGDIIEHHDIFKRFYDIHSERASNSIVQRLEEAAERKTDEVAERKANEVAERKANEVAERKANEVVENALKDSQENIKESAKDEVKKAVEVKMAEITRKNSEMSVTILGIFAAIMVTIVGSWVYSSSILASVKDANFFRLISVAALVGLISFCLIYVMFRFIEKLSGKGADREQDGGSTITRWWQEHFPGWVAIVICTVLIVIMTLGIYWQFTCPEKGDSKSFEESQSDTDNSEPAKDINVNVNIDTSDGVEISTEDSSAISEAKE